MIASMPTMRRIPPTLRALTLLPLLALGADHARAAIACGPGAQSCLEASGNGWLGVAGVVALLVYAAGLATGLARLAVRRSPGFLRLWLLGTAGVAAVCGGQALLAAALGDGAALGGGWSELLAFCALAGAVLALALRVAPAAAAVVRSLRPSAPRPLLAAVASWSLPAPPARRPRLLLALAAPGRGPPAPLG
jgi:hypothetical protein